MSRLIVKNLPKSITENRLREEFGKKGLVTDVKLKYTKTGVFRGFAFVGFKQESEAQAAKDSLNDTFVFGSKIKVETCIPLGETNKPRAWSKYSKDSSSYQKNQNRNEETKQSDKVSSNKKKSKDKNIEVKKEVLEKVQKDPQFAEFLEVNRRKDSKPSWTNDTGDAVIEKVTGKSSSKSKHKELIDSDYISDSQDEQNQIVNDVDDVVEDAKIETAQKKKSKKKLTDMEFLKSKMVKNNDPSDKDKALSGNEESTEAEEMMTGKKQKKPIDNEFTVKLRNLTYKIKKSDIKEFFSPLNVKRIRLPFKIKGIAYVQFHNEKEVKKSLLKHRSFLKGHKIEVVVYDPKETNKKQAAMEEKRQQWEQNAKDLEQEETIAESGRLFIRNLSYSTTEDELREHFAKYGPLTEVNLPIDKFVRRSKGFAFITYMIPENAVKAYTEEDGKNFQGRTLHILPGKAPLDTVKVSENMSFKDKKETKEKLQSGSDHNWNSLFLGADAVAQAMAERYNVEKSKILNPETSESIAIRMALGETQLVSETRDFLLKNGVQLDAFQESGVERSKTVILVKNLPEKTLTVELLKVFSVYGEIGRIILPPHGITAVVEFLEPSEARTAFRNLAYTKFKHVPLFLEWAPMKIFASSATQKINTFNSEEDMVEENTEDKKEVSEDEDEDEEPEPDTTVFVKNLNFATSDEALHKHFRKCGAIHYASVSKKKDLKNPGNLLSMGFGFVQFKKKEAADLCLKELQRSMLDNHSLELKLSNRTINTPESSSRKVKKEKSKNPASTKILVRNIPFQAKQSEVQELFKTFGELKSVRLPRKLAGTGSHRGFGFVDFFTKQDAKRAFNALSQSTHLFGRRLVLEWADSHDTVDDLRKRTADHFHRENDGLVKKKPKSNVQVDDFIE